ncbi:MAG: RsbRD N-terminal domain-containing protein [Phycisphaerales bacterium]|nr:MAG: RsbRD N-terminal domain-containing protein [Phycisphaerales bacterium]
MKFGELLREKTDAIVQRWFADVSATYPGDTAVAFRRQKDPFGNPVGHSLRVGTRRIFEALRDGVDAAEMEPYLRDMVKIRAVQQFSASQAVGFVFRLKEAVRAELGQAVEDPQFMFELAELERRIDRVALAAFDVFVECREQVCELRVNEVKRSVSWLLEKTNERRFDRESPRSNLG